MNRALKLGDSLEALVELEHFSEREYRVEYQQREQCDHDPNADRCGKLFDERVYHRMDDVHDQNAGDAPDYREFKADIALDVEGVVAVIPPFVVEKLLHDEADQKFDRGGEKHTAEEQQHEVAFHML